MSVKQIASIPFNLKSDLLAAQHDVDADSYRYSLWALSSEIHTFRRQFIGITYEKYTAANSDNSYKKWPLLEYMSDRP